MMIPVGPRLHVMRNDDCVTTLPIPGENDVRVEGVKAFGIERRLDFVGAIDHIAMPERRTRLISLEYDEPPVLVMVSDFLLAVLPRLGETGALVGHGHEIQQAYIPGIVVALVQRSARNSLEPPGLPEIVFLRVHHVMLALRVQISPIERKAIGIHRYRRVALAPLLALGILQN